MEIRQAIAQVSEIREHLARTEVFRGYRSLTVGFSGLVGLAAAVVQASWLPKPTERLGAYLALWFGAAAINLVVVGVEIWFRARTARHGPHSAHDRFCGRAISAFVSGRWAAHRRDRRAGERVGLDVAGLVGVVV